MKTDVTNNADTALTGEVTAIINPPAGGGPLITVKQTVTVAAHTKQTVSFTPAKFGSLKIANPKLWWPYSMGDQPLYGLTTAVTQGGVVSTSSKGTFGVHSISSRLVGQSKPLPQGARLFGINGKEFVFRGGGYAPDLFLRYDKADVAHQISLSIRLEGHDMPQDFDEQANRAGLLVIGGFLCCDAWQPGDASKLTDRDYRIFHDSAYSIGQRERNHPSVFNYGWSDNEPLPKQESVSLAGFKEADFQVPIIASPEYKSTPTLGHSGEKEGRYDWVPPSCWYDTTHFDATDDSRTNAGGSWGFASEQSAGHTVPTPDSIKRFLSPAEPASGSAAPVIVDTDRPSSGAEPGWPEHDAQGPAAPGEHLGEPFHLHPVTVAVSPSKTMLTTGCTRTCCSCRCPSGRCHETTQ